MNPPAWAEKLHHDYIEAMLRWEVTVPEDKALGYSPAVEALKAVVTHILAGACVASPQLLRYLQSGDTFLLGAIRMGIAAPAFQLGVVFGATGSLEPFPPEPEWV